MKAEEIIEIRETLRRNMKKPENLTCLGCEHKQNDCGIQGCAILREAADLLEELVLRCCKAPAEGSIRALEWNEMNNELNIGSTVEWKGKKYKIKEGEECTECAFYYFLEQCHSFKFRCSKDNRADEKDVIFVKS